MDPVLRIAARAGALAGLVLPWAILFAWLYSVSAPK